MTEAAEPATPDLDAIQERAANMTKGAAVREASPERTGKQRRYLRGLGHAIKPLVRVGHGGLTPGVSASIDEALAQHELVKVKLLENAPDSTAVTALWIHEATGADVVQILGRTLLAYRRRKKDPEIRLPAE